MKSAFNMHNRPYLYSQCVWCVYSTYYKFGRFEDFVPSFPRELRGNLK